MRAIQVTEYVKGPRDLQVSTLPDPIPQPNQYTIAIHATATNFFDLLQIRGKYQHQPPLPWISGSEFAGTIVALPPASQSPSSSSSSSSSTTSIPSATATTTPPKFQIGDAIFGASQGGYATLVCAEEERIRRVPPGWTFFDAAGLMVTAPTAYAALVTRAQIKQGDTVLVHAAAGGVGLAAVQVAKTFGATVIATAGSARKRAVARQYGADHCVDYGTAGWEKAVKALTPGQRGVDIVFDPVGMVDGSLRCTAWNGRIVVVGFAAGTIEKIAMNRVLLKNVAVVGLHWGMYAREEAERVEEVWAGLERLMAEGKFRGTCFTDREFAGLDRVGEALEALGARETWGKVVVKVDREGGSKL